MSDSRVATYKIVESLFKTGNSINNIFSHLRELNIPDQIIQECIDKYNEKFNQTNKEDTLIDKENHFKEWFTEPKENDESHWGKLKNILEVKKSWKSEMIESLNSSSNTVLKKLADPKVVLNSDEKINIKGLVLGYVQSGKTANYSAVIAKAIDAGYKFIIVLSGIHNNLRYQTEVRLRKEIVEPSELKADPITKMEVDGDFNEKITQSANRVLGSNEGFGIAVLKKNASVLKKFNKWLKAANKDLLNSTPVLIIDDESDQASIDTSKKTSVTPTTINKEIREIINNFKILSYVGYTATPFANILIDTKDKHDLFPRDFIVSLRKPIGYIGAEEIFGLIDNNGVEQREKPLIRNINEFDRKVISASKKGEEKEYDNLPPSLIYAIDSFIIAGAIRIARKQGDEHISMLVHGSYLKKDQDKVHKLIEEQVRLVRSDINRSVESTISRLIKIRDSDFNKTSTDMSIVPQDISKEDFTKNLKYFLDVIIDQIILDNSESDKRLSFEEKFWGIIVGGNTLSRGLTIEGLTISYFIRNSLAYDSLMQMGRWFGYRPGYLDLKRIFITNELKNKFIELASIENEIREEISVMVENEERPIDLRIRIRQHPGMTVTSKNKMKSAITVQFSLAGRRIQPRYLDLSKKIIRENENAVFKLLAAVQKQGIKKEISGFLSFRTSLLYQKIKKESIIKFLNEYTISEKNSNSENSILLSYIKNCNDLNYFNLAIMSQISAESPLNLPNGETINLVNRSISNDDSDVSRNIVYVKGLAIPRDEMIDMFGNFPNPPKNVDEIVDMNGEKHSFTYLRKKYRPKDRALLVIYPINAKSMDVSVEVEVVWGIMFVFPDDKTHFIGKYIENKTI